jgi:hypothetical protein
MRGKKEKEKEKKKIERMPDVLILFRQFLEAWIFQL